MTARLSGGRGPLILRYGYAKAVASTDIGLELAFFPSRQQIVSGA